MVAGKDGAKLLLEEDEELEELEELEEVEEPPPPPLVLEELEEPPPPPPQRRRWRRRFFGSLDPSAWSWRQTTVCGPWDKRSSFSSCCGFGITASNSALVMNPSPFASIRSARAVAVFIVSMPSSSMSMLATSATLSLKTDGRVVNAWHSASRPKHTVTRSIEGRIASCQRGRGGRAAAATCELPQLSAPNLEMFYETRKLPSATLVPLVIAPRARIHTNNRRGYE